MNLAQMGLFIYCIGDLDRITVLQLITELARDSLNKPYNMNSAREIIYIYFFTFYIKIQNIVKTLLI